MHILRKHQVLYIIQQTIMQKRAQKAKLKIDKWIKLQFSLWLINSWMKHSSHFIAAKKYHRLYYYIIIKFNLRSASLKFDYLSIQLSNLI
jgi:hypothetical protein